MMAINAQTRIASECACYVRVWPADEAGVAVPVHGTVD